MIGRIGLGALAYGASFLLVKARTELIEVPTVYTETQMIEVPTVYTETRIIKVEVPVEVPTRSKVSQANPTDLPTKDVSKDRPASPPAKVDPSPNAVDLCEGATGQVTSGGVIVQCDAGKVVSARPDPKAWRGDNPASLPPMKVALPPPPQPAPTTETHPWDQLADKEYRGRVTDANVDHVCFAKLNETPYCVEPVLVDANGHAVLDPEGNDVADKTRDSSPMRKWIGYSVYSADNPKTRNICPTTGSRTMGR